MKKQLIAEITKLYKSTLNPKSKWYQQDIQDFEAQVNTKTEGQLKQQLANMKGIAGLDEKVNRQVKAEIKLMNKGGMFNVGNMKPVNALD